MILFEIKSHKLNVLGHLIQKILKRDPTCSFPFSKARKNLGIELCLSLWFFRSRLLHSPPGLDTKVEAQSGEQPRDAG